MYRTELNPEKSTTKINLDHEVLSLGSCFSEIIGQKLKRHKFKVLNNPFGTIYSPLAIAQLLNICLEKKTISKNTFVQNLDVWYNYLFHSRVSSLDLNDLKRAVNQTIAEASERLRQARWLMITLGTSYSFIKKNDGLLVSNCHKIPQTHFDRNLVDHTAIHAALAESFREIKDKNTHINIILTVSPVRHLRDGLLENSISKSHLRLASSDLEKEFDFVHYFPSYELLLDDLRDYRFYARDMVHPAPEAEDYIWKKFVECYIDDDSQDFMENWKSILASLDHRPFHPNSSEHQDFLKKLLSRLKNLQSKVNVDKEIEHVRSHIMP